jgi:SAM-dependent methyltransferase
VNVTRDRLLALIGGFRVTQMIRTAALLGICDRLVAGPREASDLAAELNADPALLHRLMRALAGIDVLEEGTDGRFSNTDMGELLRSDVPETAAAVAVGLPDDHVWKAWSRLHQSVVDGSVPHDIANDASFWELLAEDPVASARFNAFMAANTEAFVPQLLDAFDFSACKTVVDVGGGSGGLIASILAAHPGLRAVLFDQTSGLEGADEFLRQRGVTDRCTVVAGDFFESVPTGGDVYLLRLILHDWEDADAARILQSARRAMAAGAHLLVIDHLLPARADTSPNARIPLVMDMHMHVLFGARERSEGDMRKMLDDAGFKVERIAPTSPARTIVAQAV